MQEGNTVLKAPKKKSPGMMGGVSPFSSSRWEPVSQELSMWSHEHDHVIDKQSRRKVGRTWGNQKVGCGLVK